MIAVLVLLLAVTFLGWVVTGSLRGNFSLLGRLGLAYGLGLGLFTYGIFLSSALGLPITLPTMFLSYSVVVFLSAVALLRLDRAALFGLFKTRLKMPAWEARTLVLGCAIAVVVGVVLLIGLYWPLRQWDELAIWGAKARAIFAQRDIEGCTYGAFPFYPLHVPISMVLMLMFGAESLVRFPCILNFMALLLVFEAFLARRVSRPVSLVFTLILATTPFLFYYASIAAAYADLTLAFYYSASVFLLYEFIERGENRWLMLSALMVGIGGWVKTEGLILLTINLVVLGLFLTAKRQWKPFTAYAVLSLPFGILWLLYSSLNFGAQSDRFHILADAIRNLLTFRVDWGVLQRVLRYLLDQSVSSEVWGWGVVGPLFFVSLLVGLRHLARLKWMLSLILLNIGALVFIYYSLGMAEPSAAEWWLITGFNRVALHFAPLLVFYSAYTFGAEMGLVKVRVSSESACSPV